MRLLKNQDRRQVREKQGKSKKKTANPDAEPDQSSADKASALSYQSFALPKLLEAMLGESWDVPRQLSCVVKSTGSFETACVLSAQSALRDVLICSFVTHLPLLNFTIHKMLTLWT
jgi:hypothetical protein